MAQNAISVELKFKIFLGGMPQDPSMNYLWQLSCLCQLWLDSYIYSYICSSFLMMKFAKSPKFALPLQILLLRPCDGSHTGEYICKKLEDMLKHWGISKTPVHLIIHDNASNMMKASREAGLPSMGCFAYTLQLVVNEGVLSQRAVIDILAISRKIVGHFKHSTLAYHRLNEIQD